ncbi:MAG: pyrroline-5-carboxylate reductase [Phycisphaerales bacterium]|jgi:pyrroline-5-carboxylate reductase|nr:pyrroline-5-carboxylate reductase [Phycisphaerales bacterium]
MTTRPHAEPPDRTHAHATGPEDQLQDRHRDHARAAPIQQALLFMGGGNMAGAILRGGLAAGAINASRVFVIEPDAAKHAALNDLRVRVSANSGDGVAWINSVDESTGNPRQVNAAIRAQVVLCVKPQMLPQAAADIRAAFASPRIVISILAGTPSSIVRRSLGEHARVVRAMPNLAVSISQGVTAICTGEGASGADDAVARAIFHAVGPMVMRLEESKFDAFTAMAGSGPAYLFYLAQGMIEGGVRAGLSYEQASHTARQTLLGAAMLLSRSDQAAESLRDAVTSKGGTTAAAVGVLDQRETLRAIADAIVAGAARGAELAKLASK